MKSRELQKAISQMRVNKPYLVEWNDSENYHGWYEDEELDDVVAKQEEPVMTYGVYKGMSENGEYIAIAQSGKSMLGSPKSNIKKITVSTIKAIHAIDTKDNLVNVFRAVAVIFVLLFASAIYFMFNPSTAMVQSIIQNIKTDYDVNILIEEVEE